MDSYSAFKSQSWLAWFYRGLIFLALLVLLARLIELQVIKGGYYRQLAEENRIRKITISAPRGKILARGGEILADNQEVKKIIKFDAKEGFTKSEYLPGGPSEEIITEWQRIYPLADKFAHLSGYLGEVNSDEVGRVDPKCPQKGPREAGRLIGRSGLEEAYECFLAGVDGEELVEVDTQGNKVRTLGRKEPIAGHDLKTTISWGLQNQIAGLMAGKKGGIVVTDAKGDVLALYSAPSFDPNLFIKKNNDQQVQRLIQDKNLPLFNRIIGGLYHPGSVFKPVVAISALEEGRIDNSYYYQDTGQIVVGTFSYNNWYFSQYGAVEGSINVVRALARSTDTFFYKIGELVGPEKIAEWASRFGLDKPNGIDIPGELAGLVPTPDWKEKYKKELWFLGNTYHLAIGQGDLAVTPLEINTMTRAIAADGKLCSPHLAKSEGLGSKCTDLKIEKNNLELVVQGMSAACSEGGTGFTFFDFAITGLPKVRQVACKTGTAETNLDGKTHAWFTAFGPLSNPSQGPEIVATVLVEGGGEGSSVAGPIAREIFDWWFENKTASN